MIFKQIKTHGDNFSYIMADENTKEAAVVDPGFNADEIENLLNDENLKLLFIINTHDHIDHVLGNDELSYGSAQKPLHIGCPKSRRISGWMKATYYEWAAFRSKLSTRLVTAPTASAC